MMPVLLTTDILILLLVAVVTGFAWYARRQPHLREPWRRVLQSRMGMASLVVLLAFIVTGLLDTLHFREALPDNAQLPSHEQHYSVEVLSVLDVLLSDMRTHVEKTYSAPFATHLFTKETIELPGGGVVREYPRLQWGGAHLEDPARDLLADVLRRSSLALAETLVFMWMVSAGLGWWLKRRGSLVAEAGLKDLWRGRTELPWQVALSTLTVIVLGVCLVINLGGHYHILGTDKVGQDVFYQAVKSIRTGLVIGTLTTLVMLPFAIMLGITAGFFQGWIDDVIQYLYTTLNSIPGVLLIAAAVLMVDVYISTHPDVFETAVERADIRLLFLCIILGVSSWTGLCRLLRGESFKLRELDYVQAAQAFGVGHGTIMIRHILPNVMHIVLIAVVLDFSGLVLAEAVLSYIGVGVDPSMNSWGNMINRARLEMARDPMVWWSLLGAFLFMFALVLAANLFSDAVRDAFDPRLRQRS